MQTEVKESGRFERTLTVHLDETELENAKDKAARKLSKDMKIKGFRPGKAPRAVVERMVGPASLRGEAIEEAIPEAVTSAIDENGLEPVTTPQVSDIRDADAGGVDVDVRITLWPEIEAMPEFAGRHIEIDPPAVTDEEMDQQFDALRNQFAELETVEREADEGDFVMINITVLADGVDVEQASASDLLYEIGSHSFLPGLDELLVAAAPGQIREGQSALPEGFTEHGGKEVALRVLVKEVRAKKLPDLTDELVDDGTEFATVDELRAAVEQNLMAMKVYTARNEFQDLAVAAVSEELDIEIPDGLIEAEVEARVHNMLHRLEDESVDFADYLSITGQTEEGFVDGLRGQARTALATRILLEGIVKIEGLEVSEDEYAEAVAVIAGQSGGEPEDVAAAIEDGGQRASLTSDILRNKALERLVESMTPVDGDGDEVDLTPIVIEGSADNEDTEDTEDTEDDDRAGAGQDEMPADETPAEETAATVAAADTEE